VKMTRAVCLLILQNIFMCLQIADSLSELEALMERMKRLQEDKEDEEASQEEMDTRFEKEKKESLLVISGGIYVFMLFRVKLDFFGTVQCIRLFSFISLCWTLA